MPPSLQPPASELPSPRPSARLIAAPAAIRRRRAKRVVALPAPLGPTSRGIVQPPPKRRRACLAVVVITAAAGPPACRRARVVVEAAAAAERLERLAIGRRQQPPRAAAQRLRANGSGGGGPREGEPKRGRATGLRTRWGDSPVQRRAVKSTAPCAAPIRCRPTMMRCAWGISKPAEKMVQAPAG